MNQNNADPPVDEPIATPEQSDGDCVVEKFLTMGQAIGDAEKQQWQISKFAEKQMI